MTACPYCSEKINLEARICKHCQRSVLHSLVLTASLDERQKHILIRSWQSLEKAEFKHLPLSAYAQAKSQLDTIPVTLAWDLTAAQSKQIATALKDLPVESRLQGGFPSNFESADKPASPYFASAYAIAAVVCLGAGFYLWFHTKAPEQSPEIKIAEATDMPTLPIVSMPTPQQEGQQPSRQSEKIGSFGREQINRLLNATVFITDGAKLGSGFFVTSDGYILTNAHVAADMAEPRVILHDGREFAATHVKRDPRLDISLLKINIWGAQALNLGDANELYQGQSVITIGNPGGLSFTVTRGIVSYVGRELEGIPYIQTDAAINRGNSGGPMINEDGEVVGINTMTSVKDQGISFAIPINFVCAAAGVTNGLATEPASCLKFKNFQDPLREASFQNQNQASRSEPTANPYQEEADALKNELDKTTNDLMAEKDKLNAQKKALESQIASDELNGSLQERLNPQINEIQKSLLTLPKKEIEAKLRYANRFLDLLQRQRGDSRFASVQGQIDAQIAQLEGVKKQLQASLDP